MRPATPSSRPEPGAPQARPGASARPASPPSPTPTRSPKKVDPGRLRLGRAAGAVGLVLRRGRAVPDRPSPRSELAATRGASASAARIHPQRHGQGADPVPPRRRAGARRGGQDVPQRGASPLAEARVVGDPGRAARTAAHGEGVARGVAALAGRAYGEANAPGSIAAFADAVSPG